MDFAPYPKTTTIDGKYNGHFWSLVGGKIENGESDQETILREIYEETGIANKEIILGPIVWFGEIDLILNNTPTRIKQKFIIAKTKQNKFSLSNLTKHEQAIVTKLAWFSLEQIKSSKEIIYPILLPKYLPNIMAGKYPNNPLKIDL